MTDDPPLGPFETRGDARNHPAVRAIYAAVEARFRRGLIGEGNHKLLCSALSDAGVEPGAFEHDLIVRYFGSEEPHVIAVIAGWVQRANRPAKPAGLNKWQRRLAEDARAILSEWSALDPEDTTGQEFTLATELSAVLQVLDSIAPKEQDRD